MISQQWHKEPLLERGFYYLVKADLFHLKKGTKVRVINAQYHQAPRSDDGGFIIDFIDMESLRLDHECDQKIIENIAEYFEKQDPFDWSQAMQGFKSSRAEATQLMGEQIKDEVRAKNKREEELVHELVAKGMTPKDAYKHLLKNRGYKP